MKLKKLYTDVLALGGKRPRVRITGTRDWMHDCLAGEGVRFGRPLCDAQLIAYGGRPVRKWSLKKGGELLVVLDDLLGQYALHGFEMIEPGGLAMIDSSELEQMGWEWTADGQNGKALTEDSEVSA